MESIRVTTHIDSETLYLPQLKPLIGKDVEIVISKKARTKSVQRPAQKKSARKLEIERELDALCAEQGVKPITDFRQLLGGWPEEERNDGFEEDLNRRRKVEIIPVFGED